MILFLKMLGSASGCSDAPRGFLGEALCLLGQPLIGWV